uniref:RNase III domain-containing protein n=2 Tax=Guillardia theta TaxID=55529 RepID=A0A7S4K5V9_GUITH
MLQQEIARQRKRCMEGKRNGVENTFDSWCLKDNALDNLETALRICPLPKDYMQNLMSVEKRIFKNSDITIDRKLLLLIAFMHVSWLKRGTGRVRKLRDIDSVRVDRERISDALFMDSPLIHQGNGGLEFLGDAILKMSISYGIMKESPEGKLKDTSIRRSMLENNELLGIMATDIWKISPVLLFAHSEMLMIRERRDRQELEAPVAARWNKALYQFSANCAEALVAVVALDKGVDAAMEFVHKDVVPNLEYILDSPSWKEKHGKDWDPISELQKVMQKRFQEEPEYKVLKEISQNNNTADMQFVVGVFMSGGNLLGVGQARSKAAARRQAASTALSKMTTNGS